MSAAAAQSPQKALPKVLRIGVFRDGKPAGERLVRHGQGVLLSDVERIAGPPAEGAPGILEGTNLSPRHELFSARGDTYTLNLPETVDGRLQWRDGIRSVEELATRGEATKKGDSYSVALTDQVRGKLVAGNLTILFQFVPAPPEPVRSINPADFRPRFIDDEDPLFLGLLGVFTLIASAFMVWVWVTPAPDHLDLEDVDAAVDLVIDREIEQIVVQDPTKPGDQDQPKDPDKPAEKPAETSASSTPSKTPGAPSDVPTQASVVKKSLLLQMIGTSGDAASGDAASDLLGDESANVARLDAALAGVSGVQQASGTNVGIKSGSGGGREDAVVGVGIATGGTAATGSGVAVTVKKPKIGFEEASTDVEEGEGGSIPSIVKKNSGRVQSCVEQSLKANPSMSGRVVVAFSIAKGRVTESSVQANTTGDDALGGCMARAIRSIRFPEDVTARVEFPYVVSGQ